MKYVFTIACRQIIYTYTISRGNSNPRHRRIKFILSEVKEGQDKTGRTDYIVVNLFHLGYFLKTVT